MKSKLVNGQILQLALFWLYEMKWIVAANDYSKHSLIKYIPVKLSKELKKIIYNNFNYFPI